MKTFGLHWAVHIVYLSTLLGGLYLGKNRMEQSGFLKAEIGQVQEVSLNIVPRIKNWLLATIHKNADAYKTPKNEEDRNLALRAVNLVDRFSKKCETLQQSVKTGMDPAQIDWSADLLTGYYLLGDSLQIFLPQETKGKEWLDRCLFSDYRACPQKQLAFWLASRDTATIRTIIQNLNLKAELALCAGLKTIQKRMRSYEIKPDALMPVISFAECPRVGQVFEATVFLAPYSISAQNVKAKINGQFVPIDKGLVHYETTVGTSGLQKRKVQFFVTNPLTGETRAYLKEM